MVRTVIALCVSLVFALPFAVTAQTYPSGPIELVVPLAPGDAADAAGRAMAAELSRQLKVPVVLSNAPGAGGAIGAARVAAARKDGYTLLFSPNGPLTIRRALDPNAAGIDPLRDLTPLALTTRSPIVLAARGDAPFKDFQQLAEYARKTPGGIRIGTPGAGSAGDIGAQIIASLLGIEVTSVPYKGAAPAVTDLLGGHIEAVLLALGALSGHLASGTLRGLAASGTTAESTPLPTLAGMGYGTDLPGVWLGFFAPAGIPAEALQVLVPALERVARDETIAARLRPLGIVQDYSPPEALAARIAQEFEAMSTLVKPQPARMP